MNQPTCGGDPEIFSVNKDGECIPPVLLRDNGMQTFGFADHDAEEPRHPIFYKDDKVTIHEDGAAFEFTHKPSYKFMDLYDTFSHGKEVLSKLLLPYNLEVYTKPTVRFNSQVLAINGVIEAYRLYCVRFGCDQDIDIYSGKFSKEVDASKIMARFAGGHIHVSPIPHTYSGAFGRLADIFMGNTFIYNTPYPDEERQRQEFYGSPGRIREQTYPGKIQGIEYRTPSVSWLKDKETVSMMGKATNMAYDIVFNPDKAMDIMDKYLEESISNIINFDRENSETILTKLGVI
jgi:hypothetical protein